ncbi:inositol monophosphatase family protein [Micromonospora polyrhachis]|uniref:Fructose-1,6-bisphosphatase/inositol monophosphatase family enzyme n=1 Tax=Micromonospora polyrhachis TaxID=1282883 RepID=A0A7W7WP86_9ACTN|nr:inositol monophosphatase family protein [Micromonospora polyrhachis]MBB4958322.1 fructose-1,6-bisphosphatase/inositol monophosphatase family enzyme [Micromonospora polyrhachis]
MIEEVGSLLRAAAATAILPRFRRLDEAEIEEKTPGELVTVADREAEQIISDGLRRLLPGSVVVGEEQVAADAELLRHLHGTAPVWLVDPLDGTANFATGQRPFAVMVALLRDGVTDTSWILDPVADRLAVARAGAGAYLDGVRVRSADLALPRSALRGAVSTRFLPTALQVRVVAGAKGLGELLPGQHCAGQEYPDIVLGVQQFALFWRTLPWDHAPGALLVQEAGGVVRRLDGNPYDPTDEQTGLLVAANERVWSQVHEALLAGADGLADRGNDRGPVG